MHFDILHNPRWVIGLLLDASVAALALRHKFFSRLPWFTIYLTLLVVVEVIQLLVVGVAGFTSRTYFWSYWLAQVPLMAIRAIVIGEACRQILAPYIGIWRLCRMLLIGVAVLLLSSASVAAYHSQNSFVTFLSTAERGLELAIVGTLVFGLAFSRYYRIRIEPAIALVVGGLAFYSAIQVASTELLKTWLGSYYPIYTEIRIDSFAVAMLMWLAAVWKPIAEQKRVELLDSRVYMTLMPEMNFRLRRLNTRLSEIMK